jgi:hypothetical protein
MATGQLHRPADGSDYAAVLDLDDRADDGQQCQDHDAEPTGETG